ncbi:maf protein [Oceaniovalibus guishaninsula JLT2003]|uniref:dTTP/UTP pyrophosphatase n=1 Tax=Oceaniovalibus guishaninsula JLT2003 TaxID=1231392 RepID=K2HBW6_9RHOB|nr:Maf family protein [Oceaniovalibus guishaninsula]EKE44978.1 maf protein [Oceaniovalibus guishaninsula JLT2003]
MRLILGSGSPRRLELLAQLGLVPDAIRPPNIDETPFPRELPRPYCLRMAQTKADALEPAADEIVLCADTTVALGRRILGKPADADEAGAFLRRLSGRRHTVVTAIAIRNSDRTWTRAVVSAVKFKRLSEDELRDYLATGDWRGKAGGYAIQGPAAAFIPWMQGSHSAIVGLPLFETAQLLRAAGYAA